MRGVSQVVTCKGRSSSVIENIGRWLSSGIDELIIVDYDCPQRVGRSLFNDRPELFRDPRVKIVRIHPAAAGPFHDLGRARNIGARAARHDLLYFVNADVVTDRLVINSLRNKASQAKSGMTCLAVSGGMFAPNQGVKSTGSVFDDQLCVSRSLLWHVGGYVEGIQWWSGGELSRDLCERIGLFAASGLLYVDPLLEEYRSQTLEHVPHDDETRDRYSSRPCGEGGYQLLPIRKAELIRQTHVLVRSHRDPNTGRLVRSGRPGDVQANSVIMYAGGRQKAWVADDE